MDVANKDEAYLTLNTSGPGDTVPQERLRVSEAGTLTAGDIVAHNTLLTEVPTGSVPTQSGVIYASTAGRC